MTIRIIVVGERRLFRRALASALAAADDFHVVGDCGRVEEIDNVSADMAIVDFDCPPGPSVDDFQPACPVLALTTEPMSTTLRQASSMGHVRGLLAKDRGLGQLIDVVRRVAAGELVFEPTRSMPQSDKPRVPG